MKTGTIDPDLKNQIDEKQSLIDHLHKLYPYRDIKEWLGRLYGEKWELTKQI